ncbi:MAG: PAS domain S-box protein [Bacteroidales bacterium]
MNSIRLIVLVSVCVMVGKICFPQRYFTKSYTIENGLPTRTVSDVCQDSTGTMWFATHNGISSYDGFHFDNHENTDGLPQQPYNNLKFDAHGVLWAIPSWLNGGIAYLKDGVWNSIPPATKRGDIEATSFEATYLDNKPFLCIGSTSGLDFYENGRWSHFDFSKDPVLNCVFSVISREGKFYVLTKAGLKVVERSNSSWGARDIVIPVIKGVISVRFEHPGMQDEKLWVLTNNTLSYFQHGKLNLFAEGFSLKELDIQKNAFVDFDGMGNVFFGNNWSKYYINRSNRIVLPLMIKNGFSSDGASSVFIDREHNVWFTDTRGVDKVGSLQLRNYYEANGLLENEVTAVAELANGNLMFGHNNGLTLFDHHRCRRIPFQAPENSINRVLDVIQDRAGNIWFAASSLGFGKLKADGTLKWINIGAKSVATAIHQDKTGTIWAATNHKLYTIHNDKLIDYEYNGELHSPLRKIFSTRNGDLLGAGLYEFYRIDKNGIEVIPFADGSKSHSFYSYYQCKTGEEYIGTLEGLCILENGKIRKFDKNGVRIDSPVYFIFQDHNQKFWIGSNNGLYKWDGNDQLEVFDIHNGLAGRETNRSAGMTDNQGNVWIGTDMGLSCFSPEPARVNNQVPSVELLFVEDSKGNNHLLNNKCTIAYNDNTLFFHFRGISFVNEDLISYRYKLDGFETKWQFVKQSDLDKIRYTNVPPGEYYLLVQAKNDAGAWSPLAKSEEITLSMPYYQAWWFNMLLILMIGALIFGLIKIILQARYNQRLEKEISERKRSEEKTLQALQALHASELKYRELIEAAVDGILLGSKEGVIIGANSYMEVLTGRSTDNLIGISINSLFDSGHLDEVPLRYDLLELGEMVQSRRRVLRPDGTFVPVEMHTKMMPDGTYQSIYHDITQRIQAEKELKESRELYKLITDKMTDVVWLMDLNRKSIFVSKSIEQFTGFTVEEYLNQTVKDRFTPDSAATVELLFKTELPRLSAMPESLPGYSNTQCLEYVCKDGGIKWGELLMTPYMGPDGSWLGIHGVTRDITDRKRAEGALKEKASELERFNNLMVGREIKMVELKKEVNEMLEKEGKPSKYKVHD